MNMINIKKGEIILCNSGFIINKKTKKEDLERDIPDLIIRKNYIDNDNKHYNCWGDIEQGDYIYIIVSFYKGKLSTVKILPQHHGKNLSELPYCSDCNTDWKEVYDWYHKYFDKDFQKFSWGDATYIKGTDSIYFPTEIIINYY